jgi:hypothetical protein
MREMEVHTSPEFVLISLGADVVIRKDQCIALEPYQALQLAANLEEAVDEMKKAQEDG